VAEVELSPIFFGVSFVEIKASGSQNVKSLGLDTSIVSSGAGSFVYTWSFTDT
jgi:hypothetical protein